MSITLVHVSLTCSCNYSCSVLSLKEADGEGYVEGECEWANKNDISGDLLKAAAVVTKIHAIILVVMIRIFFHDSSPVNLVQ